MYFIFDTWHKPINTWLFTEPPFSLLRISNADESVAEGWVVDTSVMSLFFVLKGEFAGSAISGASNGFNLIVRILILNIIILTIILIRRSCKELPQI